MDEHPGVPGERPRTTVYDLCAGGGSRIITCASVHPVEVWDESQPHKEAAAEAWDECKRAYFQTDEHPVANPYRSG